MFPGQFICPLVVLTLDAALDVLAAARAVLGVLSAVAAVALRRTTLAVRQASGA